jgi:fucose permease
MSIANPSSIAPGASVKGTAFIHLDFVLTGVVMTLLGPMLPVLSRRWSLDDTEAGYLFIGQWVTSLFGMLLSGVLVERYGYRVTLILGLLLMALGTAGLEQTSWIAGMASVCIFGAGSGVTTPAANLLIAKSNPARSASALNLLNSSWGVGAMACPFIAALAQRSHHTSYFLYGMAIALLGLAGSLSLIRFTADRGQRSTQSPSRADLRVWDNRLVPVIAGLFFVYVGVETSLGGWVASYARRVDPRAVALWAITPSFFWGALLIGRAFAPIALRHLRETKLAKFGVALASVGIIFLLLAKSIAVIMIGASLSGLGLASVFPINVSLLSYWFGDAATRVSGTIFSIGNLGGAAMPWLVGLISTHLGLRFGFAVPLLGALSMLLFYASPQGLRSTDASSADCC